MCEPDGSVEMLEEPQVILTILQAVYQDNGKIWETLKIRDHDEAPCLLWINAPSCALFLKKPKG